MKLGTKIAYNTIVQFISKILSTALGLIAIALITRYLGQTGFGEYTTAITFLTFFGIIADLGLTLVTVQMISRPNVNQDQVLGNLLALRLVSAIIFLGLAPLTVIFLPYGVDVKLAVAVGSFSFLCIALNQILVGLFQKHLRMDKVAIAEIISRLALVAGTIVVIAQDRGLMGIMVITVLSSAVSFVLHFLFSRSFARIRLRFDFPYWRKIVKYSWPLAITVIFNLIYLKTDTLLLSVLKRPSEIGIIAEVGIYGAAYKIIDVLITLPFMFAGIILPILSARWERGDRAGFMNILQRSFDLMVIMAIPLVIGTQLISRDIMILIAGQEFAASGPILQILIGAAALIYLGVMFSHAIIAINKQRKIISYYLFTAVTAVLGYVFLIPRFSYLGAAWTTIYSELVIALAAGWLVWRYTKFRPCLRVAGKSFLAAIIMAIFMLGWQKMLDSHVLVTAFLAVIVYFPTLYLLGGIKKQDILQLKNK